MTREQTPLQKTAHGCLIQHTKTGPHRCQNLTLTTMLEWAGLHSLRTTDIRKVTPPLPHSIPLRPTRLTSRLLLPEFYHTRVALSSCDTLSSGQAISNIPKSNTWSITSTIQRASTDNNGFSTESRPTRVSSVVQSTPFSVPPGSLDTITGRTSVTRLRKSFDVGIRQNDGTQEFSLDQACSGKSELKDKSKGWPLLDVLDEHPADDPPNQPTSPSSPTTPKPQRKGKVTELKKAFERGLSDLVRKRRAIEPKEEGPAREGIAKDSRPGHSVKAIDTSSPEDNPSKGSLFCSSLPMTRRREPNGPVSPLKDKISIFEGLVKPSSSSQLAPGCHQGNANTATFLTGDKMLDSGSNKPTSRLPSKFRGAPAAAKRSPKQLRTGRRETEDENSQSIDPPSFFRRLSSTLKHKRKPSRQHCAVASNSRAEHSAEEAFQHSSPEAQSTPRSQKQSKTEERQRSAAHSLRQRLESELRSSTSTNGNRVIQADQPAGGKQRHDPFTGSQYDQPSIVGIRRKSTLWVTENPFDLSKTKDRSKSEATGGRLTTIGDRYSGHTECNDFSDVALAHVSTAKDVTHQNSSANRYLRLTESPQPQKARSSDQTNSTSGQAKDGSSHSGGSEIVVVANAECELTHPRPSRSSEKKMIRVLCKCGRETGEEQDSGGQDSMVSVSKGSSDSFHTAPFSASIC